MFSDFDVAARPYGNSATLSVTRRWNKKWPKLLPKIAATVLIRKWCFFKVARKDMKYLATFLAKFVIKNNKKLANLVPLHQTYFFTFYCNGLEWDFLECIQVYRFGRHSGISILHCQTNLFEREHSFWKATECHRSRSTPHPINRIIRRWCVCWSYLVNHQFF